MNLNLVNELIFDRICEYLSITPKSIDYGNKLNSKLLESTFPICNRYWTEINEKRNQRTEAHSYDKFGSIRSLVTVKELDDLVSKEKKPWKSFVISIGKIPNSGPRVPLYLFDMKHPNK